MPPVSPAKPDDPEEEDEDDNGEEGWREFAEIVKRIIFGPEHSPTLDPVPENRPKPAQEIRRRRPAQFIESIREDPLPSNQQPIPIRKHMQPPATPAQPSEFSEQISPKLPGKGVIPPKFQQPKPAPESELKPEPKPELMPPMNPKKPKMFTRPLVRGTPGRQRKKDGHNDKDGVKQLFELWWEQSRGATFQAFFKSQLSEDMRSYYPKEYIYGGNPKSAAEYRQWRKAWLASRKAGTHSAARSARPATRAI